MSAHRPHYPPIPPVRAPSVKRTFDELGHDPEPSVATAPRASGSRVAAPHVHGNGQQADRHKRARSASVSSESDPDEIVFSPQGSSSSSLSSPSGNASGTDFASGGGNSSNVRNRSAVASTPHGVTASPEAPTTATSATEEHFRVSMERYNTFNSEISVLRRTLSPEQRNNTPHQVGTLSPAAQSLRPRSSASVSDMPLPEWTGQNSATWWPWRTPVGLEHVREISPAVDPDNRTLAPTGNGPPSLLNPNEDHIPSPLYAFLEPAPLPRIPDLHDTPTGAFPRSERAHSSAAPSRPLMENNLNAFSRRQRAPGRSAARPGQSPSPSPRYVSPVDEDIVFPNRQWDTDSDDDSPMTDADAQRDTSAASPWWVVAQALSTNAQAELRGNPSSLRDPHETQSTMSRAYPFSTDLPSRSSTSTAPPSSSRSEAFNWRLNDARPDLTTTTASSGRRIQSRLDALAGLYRDAPSIVRSEEIVFSPDSESDDGRDEFATPDSTSAFHSADLLEEPAPTSRRSRAAARALSRSQYSEQMIQTRPTAGVAGSNHSHGMPRSTVNLANESPSVRPSSSHPISSSMAPVRHSPSRPRPTSAMFPSNSLVSESAAERRRLFGGEHLGFAPSMDWVHQRDHGPPVRSPGADGQLGRLQGPRRPESARRPASSPQEPRAQHLQWLWHPQQGGPRPSTRGTAHAQEHASPRRLWHGWLDPLDDSPAREASPERSQSIRILLEMTGRDAEAAARAAERPPMRASEIIDLEMLSRLEANRRARSDRLAELRSRVTAGLGTLAEDSMEALPDPDGDVAGLTWYREVDQPRETSRQPLPSIQSYFNSSPEPEPAARTTGLQRPVRAPTGARLHSRVATSPATRLENPGPSSSTTGVGPSGRHVSRAAAAAPVFQGRDHASINLDDFHHGPFRDSLARSMENARRRSAAFREANLAPPSAASRPPVRDASSSNDPLQPSEPLIASEFARSALRGDEYIPDWLRDADTDQLDLTDLGRPTGRDGRPSADYNPQPGSQDLHDYLNRHVRVAPPLHLPGEAGDRRNLPRVGADVDAFLASSLRRSESQNIADRRNIPRIRTDNGSGSMREHVRHSNENQRLARELWGDLPEDRETLSARQRRLDRLHALPMFAEPEDVASLTTIRHDRRRNAELLDFHRHWGAERTQGPALYRFGGSRHMGDYVRDGDFDTSYEGLLNLADLLGEARPRGLSEQDLATLPRSTYQEWATPGESSERCPICLDDYEATDPVLRVPYCQHWFHANCLEQWLKTARTCPVCRGRVAGPGNPSSMSPERAERARYIQRRLHSVRNNQQAQTANPAVTPPAADANGGPARHYPNMEFEDILGTPRARPRGLDRRRD